MTLDWTVYPNSRIAGMRSRCLQRVALVARNVRILASGLCSRENGAVICDDNSTPNELAERRVFEELQLGVRYVHEAAVVGDIAEFGSHGRTASAICREMAHLRTPRHLHLFDSFEGLPRSDHPVDVGSPHVRQGVWRKGGCMSRLSPAEMSESLERLFPARQVHIHAGWFRDTLPDLPGETRFAMVNIDCDLYSSAYEVLEYLFSRRMLSEGCILFFDDWNCNHASPDFGERKAWAEMVGKFKIAWSDGGAYGWGGHKFYVHAYAEGDS